MHQPISRTCAFPRSGTRTHVQFILALRLELVIAYQVSEVYSSASVSLVCVCHSLVMQCLSQSSQCMSVVGTVMFLGLNL